MGGMRRAPNVALLAAGLFLAVFVAGCGPFGGPTATPTIWPTETLRPRPPNATPTAAAPMPTATRPPASPTPAPPSVTPFPPTATHIPATTTPVPPTPVPATPRLVPPTLIPPTATPVPPTPTPVPPTPTLPPDPVCFVQNTRISLRSGPGVAFRVIQTLGIGEELLPIARNPENTWLQVVTLDSLQGWIVLDRSLCQHLDLGRLPAVVVPLPPTPTRVPPTATALVIREWRGEYYNNPNLSGLPVLVRNDVDVNFDWGGSAPSAAVPVDGFSVRWTRVLTFAGATYRFFIRADDGARLFLDDVLVLDMWVLGSARTQSVDVIVSAGQHVVRMEYFENTGAAVAALWWDLAQFGGWRGEYHGNANLSGAPAFVRDDESINFDWGLGAPAASLPVDNFSVRWTRSVAFEAGVYRFRIQADDGVRLWIDGSLLMDHWTLGSNTYVRDITLTDGLHSLRLDYFEASFGATVILDWQRQDVYPNYRGEYYNNDTLLGSPVFQRNDPVLDFIWGLGSPDVRLNSDYFSARWTGRPNIGAGVYRLRAESDDGVRVWVNGVLLIDAWQPGGITAQAQLFVPTSGPQDLRVDYFERTGDARLHVWWTRISGLTPD